MSLIEDSKAGTPAVVVGSAGVCGLGVIRSLSHAKVPVILLDVTRRAPAMYTRFAHKILISELSGRSLIRDLQVLATRIPVPAVLFLTSDEAVLTVSEYRAELEGTYRFTLPSHDCLTALAQKTTFQDLAESLGFPVPRCLRISSVTDIHRVAELQFPAVVKPAIKTAAYVNGNFARGYKVFSPQEAETACRLALTAVPDLVVQEWVEGADSDLYFCLLYRTADGSILSSFVGRKLSVWPPDVGLTASCTAAPEEQESLLSLTEAFFRRVSFVGMGGIEFKKDVRTGRFLMIEPTIGRVDAQEEVATIHGANIPLMAYFHEAGLPVRPTSTTGAQVVWRSTWAHWRAARHSPLQRLESHRLKVRDAYWRLNDPLPALVYSLTGAIKFLGAALRRYLAVPQLRQAAQKKLRLTK